MHLIVDSGSTKTLWCLINAGEIVQKIFTKGINPYITSRESIENIIVLEVIPNLKAIPNVIFYYGAGCSTDHNKMIVENELLKINVDATIEVEHDLLAVARALCQDKPGIAVILGTGSNSCLYDGNQILQNTPSLGFILGDEGSGSYLGKKLVSDVYYGILPPELKKEFDLAFDLGIDDLLLKVYKQEAANAYLASFCVWISKHKEHPFIQNLIKSAFTEFIQKHILPYKSSTGLPIHSIGSIAFYFQKEWRDIILKFGYTPGKVEQEPTAGLITYHLKWKN